MNALCPSGAKDLAPAVQRKVRTRRKNPYGIQA
jgi:hypothetical protein